MTAPFDGCTGGTLKQLTLATLTFGARFLIAATRTDIVWYYLPPFVNALALPLALFGYGDWRNAGATRMGLTLFGFMFAFSIIGLPCNDYWGFVFLPLLCDELK